MKGLEQKQSLPLPAKIIMSERRIREWYEEYDGNVYVAFSGGKDSTALLHLVRQYYPDVKGVFCDTGLEYPEIKEFVKSTENITIIKPKMSFREVINKFGYPVTTKTQAGTLYKLKNHNLSDKYRKKLMFGDEKGSAGMLSKKWRFLLDEDIKISDKCCYKLKIDPFKKFEKDTGLKPFVGTMAENSTRRKMMYNRYGCNIYNSNQPRSTPISFWMTHDVWRYIKEYDVDYCKLYDTGIERTGCIFCMFGVHLDNSPNRFEQLKQTHPTLHKYCIDDLGMKKVLDLLEVKY